MTLPIRRSSSPLISAFRFPFCSFHHLSLPPSALTCPSTSPQSCAAARSSADALALSSLKRNPERLVPDEDEPVTPEQESEVIKEVALPLNGSREVAGVLPARQEQDLVKVVEERWTFSAPSWSALLMRAVC